MQNPFVWSGNQPVDQNQLATRRALANALTMRAIDTSPVQHWTQALARVAQGVAAMRQGQFADEDEGKAKAELGSVRNAMLGGDAAPAAAPQGGLVNVTPPPPQNPLMRAGDAKGYDNPASRALYDAAIARGYSPVQAAAFVGAGALPESTLNPNARNPGDGRDGSDSIGMFQWNSSRAKALQEFAASKGKPWNDPNVQAEFALAELEGPEAKAGQMLRGAKTPEEATGAMLAYLRPGGYKPGMPQGVPSYAARLRNTAGIMSSFSGGMAQPQQPLAGVQPMQEQPPVQVAQAPQATPAGQPPQVVAAPAGGISQERLKAAYTILNSPFAGPGDKAVAQTIIQKALTAETRDPRDSALKDVQLESGRLGLEKTRRELGSVKSLVTPEERKAAGVPEDYRGAVQIDQTGKLLFPGQGNTTTVNIGQDGQQYGNPGEGLVWQRDASGKVAIDERGAPIAIPYRGGKMFVDESKRADAKAEQTRQKANQADLLMQDIDRTIGLMDTATIPTTGGIGSLAKNIPGTAAADMSKLLDGIKANIGFDKLSEMRAASPTGAALGSVTEKELAYLQSVVGSLDQSQSPQQFRFNMLRLKNAYLDTVHGIGKGPPRERLPDVPGVKRDEKPASDNSNAANLRSKYGLE